MQKTYIINTIAVKRLMLERWGTTDQEDLAKETNLSKGTIVRLFQGKPFRSDSLYQLCQALECTPNDILVVASKED